VKILWPGDASALYHHEDAQQGFLVLIGESIIVVEGSDEAYAGRPDGFEPVRLP
jgi:uncharacterized cupin superfamily protein